jgi:hypothetical protein
VHLAPNSITIIATFIHLCEAYLGITPHFHLWCHFFELKKTGKGVVVDSVGFMLRQNMKSEYIDLMLLDNTTGWKQGWFYLDNPTPALKEGTGQAPVSYPEWTNQLASRDTEELQPLLDYLEQIKVDGLRRGHHLLLPPPHPTSPGSGPPVLRVLGAIRPHPGHSVQGLQGRDDGSHEEYLWRVDPQQRVPQGTRSVQPLRPGKSLTLMFIRVRSVRVYIFGVGCN